MPTSDLSDEELIEKYRSAADPAQGLHLIDRLFRRHHKRVGAWCLRLAGDREQAADLAQEVFLKAFSKLETFEGKSRFTTWLYMIARNHCLNELQSRARLLGPAEPDAVDHLPDPESDGWADRIHRKIDSRALLEFLGRSLSETEERVMVLHFGEGFPLQSITRLLRLRNPSGAKAFVVSARRKIDRALIRHQARRERLRHSSK